MHHIYKRNLQSFMTDRDLWEYLVIISILKQRYFMNLRKKIYLSISQKRLTKKKNQWTYEAMTPDGVKIIALEDVEVIEDKR